MTVLKDSGTSTIRTASASYPITHNRSIFERIGDDHHPGVIGILEGNRIGSETTE